MTFNNYEEFHFIKSYNDFVLFVQKYFQKDLQINNNFTSLIGTISVADTIMGSIDFQGDMIEYLKRFAKDLKSYYVQEDFKLASDLWKINLDKTTTEGVIGSLDLHIPNKNLILTYTKDDGYTDDLDLHLHEGDTYYNTTVQFNVTGTQNITINISSLDINTLIIDAPNIGLIELVEYWNKSGRANLVFSSPIKELCVDPSEIEVYPAPTKKPTLKFTYGKVSEILPQIADEETISVLKKLYDWN